MSRRSTFVLVLAGALFPFVCGGWFGVAQPADYIMEGIGRLVGWRAEDSVYLSDRQSIAIYLTYVATNSLFWVIVFVGAGRILSHRHSAT